MDSNQIQQMYSEIRKKYEGLPENLKEEQVKVISSILNGKNTFGVLPTGYGKSLCYSVPPLILCEVDNKFMHHCIYAPMFL